MLEYVAIALMVVLSTVGCVDRDWLGDNIRTKKRIRSKIHAL